MARGIDRGDGEVAADEEAIVRGEPESSSTASVVSQCSGQALRTR